MMDSEMRNETSEVLTSESQNDDTNTQQNTPSPTHPVSPTIHRTHPYPEQIMNQNKESRMDSLENYMGSQLSHIIQEISSLGQTIKLVQNQFNHKFESVENGMLEIKSRVSGLENPDPEIQFQHRSECEENGNNNQNMACETGYSNFDNYGRSSYSEPNLSRNVGVKMKPQNFSGDEDLEDFLAQFEITSEINRWSYSEKSLYLASSLTRNARSILTEMKEGERRDFSCLVSKLKTRFGSEHKAEIFRTQLKTRVRQKNESIPELAHSVRKMTRQAYPTASSEVVEALSLDSFIDALNDSDIRLRLRELSLKTLAEAEQVALRMEAHRLSDRQRSKLVGNVNEMISPKESSTGSGSHSNVRSSNQRDVNTSHEPNRSRMQGNVGNRNEVGRSASQNSESYSNSQNYRGQSRGYRNGYRGKGRFNEKSRRGQYNGNYNRYGNQSYRNGNQGNEQMSGLRDRNSTSQVGPALH